jgi:putative intracellular protease/amidase
MKLLQGTLLALLVALVGCAAPSAEADDELPGDEAALTEGKAHVLVILSGARSIELARGGTTDAGVYLAEVAVPIRRMLRSGAQLTIVSPGGTPPTLDEVSDKAKWFESEEEYEGAKELFARPAFRRPAQLESITDAVLERYDAVFIPGGHAPMDDLYKSKDVARILRRQHARKKLTGAICHGTSALLAPVKAGEPWIYDGYRLTGYSASEESLGVLLGYVGGSPKLGLQTELQDAGAMYSQSFIPFTSHVVRDRELVTGQDPQSTHKFAEVFTAALNDQFGKK